MCFCTSAKPWKPEGPRKAPTLLAAEGLHKLRVLMHACGILKGADGLGQVQVGNFMVSYTVIAAWQAQIGEGRGLLWPDVLAGMPLAGSAKPLQATPQPIAAALPSRHRPTLLGGSMMGFLAPSGSSCTTPGARHTCAATSAGAQ